MNRMRACAHLSGVLLAGTVGLFTAVSDAADPPASLKQSPKFADNGPSGQTLAGTGGCTVFFDKASFDLFNSQDGKLLKGIESFDPVSNVPVAGIAALVDPLTGNIPNVDALGLGFPTGLENKNLVIQSNLLGLNAPVPMPGDGLVALGQGFIIPPNVPNSVVVGANFFPDSTDLIFDDAQPKTGVGFDVIDPVGLNQIHITVFDTLGVQIHKEIVFTLDIKLFFGIWCPVPIGRINVAGVGPDGVTGGEELVDNIQMWIEGPPVQPPNCPADFDDDKRVGITDLLALLARWGPCPGCIQDMDNNGVVNVVDLLALLAAWGPCPAPVNDECSGRIGIPRDIIDGVQTVTVDMRGATPSTPGSACLGLPLKDAWWCLTNTSTAPKSVRITTNFDVFVEVYLGCGCNPNGPLLVCGPGMQGTDPQFPLLPGEQVQIRLLNWNNLPNEALKGTMEIINKPLIDPLKCYDQPPNQINGIFSDVDCDFCTAQGLGPIQTIAEQLPLTVAQGIDRIRFWGGYFPGNIPLAVDSFTVKFWTDVGGMPGVVINKFSGVVPTSRTATGVILFGVDEYEYVIDLVPNKDLLPGNYWIEIFNDTTGSPESWFWETGNLDPLNGLPGSVFSFSRFQGEVWNFDQLTDMALNLTCKEPGGGDPLNFFTDPFAFQQALQDTGKVSKGSWNFKPDFLPAGIVVPIGIPLDITTHALVAPGVWSDPADPIGVWPPEIDNVQFWENAAPQQPLVPGSNLIYAKAPAFGLNNNALMAEFPPWSFHIVSGPPAGTNHTAMGLELVGVTAGAVGVIHVTVFDKMGNILDKRIFTLGPDQKQFVGFISKDNAVTIGAVDIWDENQGMEGISAFELYFRPGPGNPPHEMEACLPPCADDIGCLYQVANIIQDPLNECPPANLVPGQLICVTPCPFPGDDAPCLPDETQPRVDFILVGTQCIVNCVPLDRCEPCPPGVPVFRRIN